MATTTKMNELFLIFNICMIVFIIIINDYYYAMFELPI